MIKFYLIVPIYNVESYLEQCLDSILAQTYENFEVIMINDGSTDKSGELALKYTQKDQRFHLINQDNQGLSMARNKALEVIKSKLPAYSSPHLSYVVCVDSDDYVDNRMLEILHSYLSVGDAECLICNCAYYDEGNKLRLAKDLFIPSHSRFFDGIYSCEEIVEERIHIHLVSMWAFVYRCDFLFATQCRFEPKLYYEDALFINELFVHSQKIKFINEPFYYYRCKREGSIMNVKSKEHILHGAYSYFVLVQRFYELASNVPSPSLKAYFRYWGRFYTKQVLRTLQPFGYDEGLGFRKEDLAVFTPYLPYKYRFCYHFPRVYYFLRRCLTFKWW